MLKKIISGGQTGVDRAALDFAINHNIKYGGYVSKGGRALDMINGESICNYYPELIELDSSKYSVRTAMNVKTSDATLICYPVGINDNDRGTKLTISMAKQYNKPYFILDGNNNESISQAKKLINDMLKNFSLILNVAGPRELKNSSIIYDNTLNILKKIICI